VKYRCLLCTLCRRAPADPLVLPAAVSAYLGRVNDVVLTIAWASGDVVAWLHETDTGWASSVAIDDANGRTGPRPAEQTMILNVENHGGRPVRIVGVGDDRTGIRTLRATATKTSRPIRSSSPVSGTGPITSRSPYILNPGDIVEITMFLQFTDCRAVSDQPWPIPIRLARPWGIQTTYILHLPIRATSDHGGWSVVYRGDPRAVEWQRWIADDVCAIPYSKRAPGNR
jgi:hypothetical protein